jgi:hypothetical protein
MDRFTGEDGAMAPNDSKKDVVLAEYKEVTAQFRALMEIRFKLLAFLPLGTVAAVYLSKDDQLAKEPAIAAFAFVATLCIATYNKRNDQHYDELVARAAELERDGLKIAHGSFSQRPQTWLKYGPISVEHRWPIGMLYAATAALWAYLAMRPLIAGQRTTFTFNLEFLTPIVIIAGWLLLRKLESIRGKKLRKAVRSLMDQLVTETPPGSKDRQRIEEAIAAQKSLFGVDPEKAARRVRCHWTAYADRHDIPAGSQFLSAVVDLPARWIADVWTGRR